MLDENEIMTKIKKCIWKVTKLDVSEIEDSQNLKDFYGLDSLDFLTLRIEVESRFDISFALESLSSMMTVRDIANEIIKQRSSEA